MPAVATAYSEMSPPETQEIFDVKTPEARARLLWSLKSHLSAFTDAERVAYDHLRDALVHMARGENGTDIAQHMQVLAHFLSEPAKEGASKEEVPEQVVVVTHPAKESIVDFSEPVLAPTAEIPSASVMTPLTVVESVPPTHVPFTRGRHGPDVAVSAPVSVVPEPERAPAPEPAPEAPQPSSAPAEIIETTDTRAELQTEIEKINDDLNAFAHGTAFKWLSNASTGYRAYLNELLELRGVCVADETTPFDGKAVRERIRTLREMAETVRTNVGGDVPAGVPASTSTPAPESALEKVPSAISATKNVALSSSAEIVPEPVVPSVTPDEEKAVDPAIFVAPSEPLNIEPTRPSEVTEVPLPSPLATPEPLLKEGEPESALMDKIPAPESPLLDVLNSRAIDTGLNDLLTRWLRKTGFVGFRKKGVKHPEWLAMKDVFVDDVLHGEGMVPPGLRPEIFDNLGQNIRAWRDAYALEPADGERVEHYIRRVVEASLPQ